MIELDNHFHSIKSILCLNGEIPSKDLFMRHQGLPLITADGASSVLIAMGIIPTLIVGDLDSIDSANIPKNIEILHITDPNTTDFEKCLHVLEARNLFPCLIYGATGKESDHTLYNLNVMAEYSLRKSLIFHDSAYKLQDKYGIFVSERLLGNLKIGSKISLLSLSSSIVSTKGLTWELDKMQLSIYKSSIRNLVKSNLIEITVHSGNALVLFDL